MQLQVFSVARLAAMPWKNGGGVTREIVCVPAGAGLDDFDWRVSVAQIDASGPFSAFAGVDRVITLLDGAGVRLRSRDGAIDHRLDRALAPFAFAGDAAVDAQLLDGACHDLNVMTRRAQCAARVQVVRAGGVLPSAAAGVLLAVEGQWRVAAEGVEPQTLDPRHGLWWQGEPVAWRVSALETAALAAILVDRA